MSDYFLAVRKRYLGCILPEPEKGCQIETIKALSVTTILILETYQKWFLWYHLPCRFKFVINVFAFLCVKENSMEICEEISFPFFPEKY